MPDDEEPEPTKEDQTDTLEEQGQGGEKKDDDEKEVRTHWIRLIF